MEPNNVLLDLAAHCSAVVADAGGLLASLFLTGLIGGPSHCAGMCGPFVLSQVTARLESTPASQMREWHRLAGAALVPYHLGRATTYVLLGVVGAAIAGSLTGTGAFRWLSAGLLAVAALVLLGMALPGLKALLGQSNCAGEGWWSRSVGRLARPLFRDPRGLRGWLLGVMLGFIPCGLLYGALAAAAATGDPVAGAMGMLAFVLGTIPTLVMVGFAGHMAANRWRGAVMRWAPLLLVLNAFILAWLALDMLL